MPALSSTGEDRFNWEIELEPSFESTLERVNSADSCSLQLQRRTGARCFVRSSAVENYFAITGNFLKVLAELCRTQYLGADYFLACSLDLCRSA